MVSAPPSWASGHVEPSCARQAGCASGDFLHRGFRARCGFRRRFLGDRFFRRDARSRRLGSFLRRRFLDGCFLDGHFPGDDLLRRLGLLRCHALGRDFFAGALRAAFFAGALRADFFAASLRAALALLGAAFFFADFLAAAFFAAGLPEPLLRAATRFIALPRFVRDGRRLNNKAKLYGDLAA
jgi:hypothetical protein